MTVVVKCIVSVNVVVEVVAVQMLLFYGSKISSVLVVVVES